MHPFGSCISSRGFSSAAYRYGFNGKEKETDGTADNYDFGARIYDGRLGRWLSVDPLFEKYPSFSPYQYCTNNGLIYTDINGMEIWISFYGSVMEERPDPADPSKIQRVENPYGEIMSVKYDKGKLYDKAGKRIKINKIQDDGARNYIKAVAKDLRKLDKLKKKDDVIKTVLDELEGGDNKHLIRNSPKTTKNGNYNNTEVEGYTSTTGYDPFSNSDVLGNNRPAVVSLGHEMKHAFNKQKKDEKQGQTDGINNEEIDAVNFENRVRKAIGFQYKRTKYSGKLIPASSLNGPAPSKTDPNEK